MTQLTNQEIFDRVSTHLITQGKQALDEGSCAYRGANDTSCAIGCLIPDDFYLSSMVKWELRDLGVRAGLTIPAVLA